MKFIGRGVFTFKGKKIGYGKDMPSGVPKETMDALKKAGKVGDILVAVTDDDKSVIAELSANLEDAKKGLELLPGLQQQLAEAKENAGGVKQEDHDAIVAERDSLAAERDNLLAERDALSDKVEAWVAANPDLAAVVAELDGMKAIVATLDGSGNAAHKAVVTELKTAAGVVEEE